MLVSLSQPSDEGSRLACSMGASWAAGAAVMQRNTKLQNLRSCTSTFWEEIVFPSRCGFLVKAIKKRTPFPESSICFCGGLALRLLCVISIPFYSIISRPIPSASSLCPRVAYPRRFPLPQFGGRTGNGFAEGAWEASSETGKRQVERKGKAMVHPAAVSYAGGMRAARCCAGRDFTPVQNRLDEFPEGIKKKKKDRNS